MLALVSDIASNAHRRSLDCLIRLVLDMVHM